MASKPIAAPRSVFESIIPIPNAQQKHTFFDAQDYIPEEVLRQVINPAEAKEIGFFFSEKKERVIGVSIGSDKRLSKIYTISQDNIKRVWVKQQDKETQKDKFYRVWFKQQDTNQIKEKFYLFAEMKPRANVKPAASTAPSTTVD